MDETELVQLICELAATAMPELRGIRPTFQTDLLAVGMDSIGALALITSLEERLDIAGRVDIAAPFHYPTPVELAGYLGRLLVVGQSHGERATG